MTDLHQLALQAAANYFRAEAVLLDILQKIDAARTYRQLGYTSLFMYAVGALKLPEGTAYNFINVARKACEVPALKTAIESAELSVGKARRIVPLLTLENQEEWIGKAKTLSQRSLEKEVARVVPLEEQSEKTKYVTESRLNLTLGISERLLTKLRRIQDLESQRTRGAASLEVALEAAADRYLEKNDPIEKAKRAQAPRLVSRQVPTDGKRRPLMSAEVHAVNLRDEVQCTQVSSDGKRCANRRWLEIHHLKPVSEGGKNEAGNLTTLCSAHHRVEHEHARLPSPRTRDIQVS